METNILKIITLADIASLANGLCGFFSIIAILQNNIVLSAQLLFLAVIFDAMDGTLARLFNNDNMEHVVFGETIDSLSDIVSFGVAPAVILYMLTGQLYMLIASALVIICGILRLSRYNTITAYTDAPTTTFIGLPIPVTAFMLGAFMLSYYNPILLFIVMVLISILMVTDIEYPKIKEIPLIVIVAILMIMAAVPFINNMLYRIPAYLILILGILYIIGIIVISVYDNRNLKDKVQNISDFNNSLNKR
ncbi:MAG: CDP-diacylglycerol--serine O-phosphatidyltransferase [Methanosphaera sp. SHI613]|jgi:CDP-diacylglycerol--serine O-phosphatidyltransferase|nr:MAG: CDP-diacylglycerol--serine O-phosphatidyltransferase [Methanosphaera sp. SHI613]